MKNTSTTLEITEGSKATIQGKVINGKNYLVVEMEREPEKSDAPEWTKFKRGDVLIYPDPENEIFVIFGEYRNGHSRHYFNCLFNSVDDRNTCWISELFRKATDAEKAGFFKWLRMEKGLEWDGEKLVKTKSNVPKDGDLCIIFNRDYSHAFIAKYAWFLDSCYDNIIKWDGTKEQYEKVLRGELK